MSQFTSQSPAAGRSATADLAEGSARAHEIKELIADLTLEMDETRQRQNRALETIASRLLDFEAKAQSAPVAQAQPAPARVPEDHGDWDQASADALRSAYDQSLAPDPARAPSISAQAPVVTPEASNWLENRLSDITQNLKATLSGVVQPQRPFSDLDDRLRQFESGIGAALEEVARRSDLGSIEGIAAEVQELSKGLGAVQNQLSRLDGLEKDLRDIVGQTVEQSVEQLMQHGSRFSKELETMVKSSGQETLAKMRAENLDRDREYAARQDELAQVIEETIKDWRGAASDSAGVLEALQGFDADQTRKHDELRTLIDKAHVERRKGEEQAIAMLDTLQEALVRVFDRLDTIENKQDAIEKRTSQALAARAAAPQPQVAPPPPASEPVRAAPAPGGQHAMSPRAPQPTPPAARDTQAASTLAPPLPRKPEPAQAVAAPAMSRPEPKADPRPAPAPAAAQQAAPVEPAAPVRSEKPQAQKPASTRDMIAEARRAQQRAASIQQAETQTIAELGDRTAKSAEKDKPAGLLGSSPRLVALALGAVVLINGLLLILGGDDKGPVISIEPMIEQPSQVGPGDDGVSSDGLGPTNADPEGQSSRLSPLRPNTPNPSRVIGNANGVTPSLANLSDDVSGSGASAGMSGLSMLDLPPASVGPLSLRLAAANGNASAAFAVASRLGYQSAPDSRDMKEAAQWYQRSAAKGFTMAHYRLGTMYERGEGLQKDLGKAQVWYSRAAEQGNVKSMHNLAVLLASKPDYERATVWFKRAAEHGLADSQFNLAVLHENGLGTRQDRVQAHKWYALAAQNGDKDAAKRRDDLGERLSASELKTAKQIFASFKPQVSDVVANDPTIAAQQWQQAPTTTAAQ